MVWAFKGISMKITPVICLASHLLAAVSHVVPNVWLRGRLRRSRVSGANALSQLLGIKLLDGESKQLFELDVARIGVLGIAGGGESVGVIVIPNLPAHLEF